MKRINLNLILGILLGAVFLWLWIHLINWDEFLGFFHNFDLKLVLVFSGFYVLAYFFRSWRWKIIIKPVEKLGFGESFFIFMTGLLINYLIPVRAGELTKSFILKVRHKTPISASLPTILIDKISDLFPIILIMMLIPLIGIQLNQTLNIIIILLLLIFVFFLGFLYFSVNHQSTALKILNFFLKIFPRHLQTKFQEFFGSFVEGMGVMQKRHIDNILVSLLTLAAVFSEAIYIFMVFKAFGADISYQKILFGYTLMNLTYILPTPPAQVGSNQFMWVLIFSFALGVDKNLTAAAVTFSHLLTTIWIFLIGAISLFTLKIKFSDLLPKLKK